MVVYISLSVFDRAESKILGVFFDKEAAYAACDKHKETYKSADCEVLEIEADKYIDPY